jgi:protein transport protein SEC31
MKLKEIRRASTFAWGPVPGESLIATGTVAGALDASFSNDSQLEIWNPDLGDATQFDLGAEGQEDAIATIVTSAK